MRVNHVLHTNKVRNPYYPLHVFVPSTLPLEISIKDGDKIWIGRNQPMDTKKYKLWLYEDIEGYETTIKVGD